MNPNSKTLFLDIRNHDEIDKKHFNSDINVLYMPANMVKYNIPFLLNEFEKYNDIKIICQSGNRSKKIKDKYFKNENKIQISSVQFNDIDKDKDVVISNEIHMNLTRKIQLISGTMILLLFLITYFYKKAIYGYLLLGVMMLYVSLSGNCFMSSYLTSNEY